MLGNQCGPSQVYRQPVFAPTPAFLARLSYLVYLLLPLCVLPKPQVSNNYWIACYLPGNSSIQPHHLWPTALSCAQVANGSLNAMDFYPSYATTATLLSRRTRCTKSIPPSQNRHAMVIAMGLDSQLKFTQRRGTNEALLHNADLLRLWHHAAATVIREMDNSANPPQMVKHRQMQQISAPNKDLQVWHLRLSTKQASPRTHRYPLPALSPCS